MLLAVGTWQCRRVSVGLLQSSEVARIDRDISCCALQSLAFNDGTDLTLLPEHLHRWFVCAEIMLLASFRVVFGNTLINWGETMQKRRPSESDRLLQQWLFREHLLRTNRENAILVSADRWSLFRHWYVNIWHAGIWPVWRHNLPRVQSVCRLTPEASCVESS